MNKTAQKLMLWIIRHSNIFIWKFVFFCCCNFSSFPVEKKPRDGSSLMIKMRMRLEIDAESDYIAEQLNSDGLMMSFTMPRTQILKWHFSRIGKKKILTFNSRALIDIIVFFNYQVFFVHFTMTINLGSMRQTFFFLGLSKKKTYNTFVENKQTCDNNSDRW